MYLAKYLFILCALFAACTDHDSEEPSFESPEPSIQAKSQSATKAPSTPSEPPLEAREEKPRKVEAPRESEDTGTVLTGGDTTKAPVDYPEITFKGSGIAICDEDVYLTKATVRTRLSETQFVMQLVDATVKTNILEDKLQEEINNNLTEIRYQLVPVAERGKIDGKDLGIFATSSLQVKQDTHFNFSSPLPVYVWPATAARFDILRTRGPKTWKALVTGKATFEVIVTMTYVKGSGNRSTIRLETSIKDDKNGELYQDFPIPKMAEITVDGDRQLIERSKNENLFDGDDRCDDTLGIVKLDYDACIRTSPGKIEDFGCAN
jgi:hypothetical protein